MVRAFMNTYVPGQGELVIEELSPNCVEVFYVPPKDKLAHSGLPLDNAAKYRVKLLVVNGQDQFLTIFPINTLGGHARFLKPKYEQVERITLADAELLVFAHSFSVPATPKEVLELLETLPSGFTKDYEFGLGLAKEYRFIIDAVEELSDCTEIVISKSRPTGIHESLDAFFIATADFEKARKALNRITNIGQTASRSVKEATAYNILAESLGRHASVL